MTYTVYENLTIIFKGEDKEDITWWWRVAHAKASDKYHEINQSEQLEPDDCWKCRRNIHQCQCAGLGYMISECLGNCEKNPKLKTQCSNTSCAFNPWFNYNSKAKGGI